MIVHAGVYREYVSPRNSGTAAFPITYQAAAGEQVIITGADLIPGWRREPGDAPIYRVPWSHRFIINHRDGKPIEHHPETAPLWGRAEQVIADGDPLLPMASREELEQAWLMHRRAAAPSPVLRTPLPNLGPAFAGAFFADTANKFLYLWLSDGSDPNGRTLEAATRGLCFGTNPWMRPEGFEHVHVRGFTFRYAASFPQRAAVWLHGAHNVLEDCVIEQMAGGGANVKGIMRRCLVRDCGHTGGGASGDGLLNEDNLWEGNSWKPIPRIWDAGGVKLTWANGGLFRHCTFRHNGGPGLWLDIHVRNVTLTDCVFDGNEGSGLFIEISRDITVTHNLARSNAVGVVGKLGGDGWSSAGIQLAESINCLVAHNTCIGNQDGITLREQGPRPLKTADFGVIAYHNHGHVIASNVCAFNHGYQLGLWYDNAWFGPHPSEKNRFADETAWQAHLAAMSDRVYDPRAQALRIDHNRYWSAPGQSLFLYGAPWRSRYRRFESLAAFIEATGFDRNSVVAEPDLAAQSRAPLPRVSGGAPATKPRLLVLTDIGGDPDDQQSLVRLLVHANEFDIEGLIASASGTPGELKERVTKPHLIHDTIAAYAQVRDNLAKHAEGFPAAADLLAVVKSGNPHRGHEAIGEGRDTDGSRWIIRCADRPDPRPLDITIWGGQTDLAQALWRVRQDRGEAGFQQFQSRLRVFDIDDQDRLHDWLFAEFPRLFYVLSKSPTGRDKREGAYRGMYLGGDDSLTSLAWLDTHVRQNHGPLGALYPPRTWTAPNPHSALKEGDTPSWFFFLSHGLGDASRPDWGGWGGRYTNATQGLFRDAPDTVGEVRDARAAVWRWREAFQNEFAARMDWCVAGDFANANHPPVVALNGDRTRQAVRLRATPGQSLTLSSAGSGDPDGDRLEARWLIYPEPGTNTAGARLSAETGERVRVVLPNGSEVREIHVILAVSDHGAPPLTRYRRAVIEVHP